MRGNCTQSEHGKVILPFTVLRGPGCVLKPAKARVSAQGLCARTFSGTSPACEREPLRRRRTITRTRSIETPPGTGVPSLPMTVRRSGRKRSLPNLAHRFGKGSGMAASRVLWPVPPDGPRGISQQVSP